MPASKNSKNSRISKPKALRGRNPAGTALPAQSPLLILAASGLLSALSIWWFYRHGYLFYYGDAQAHLTIARRVVDSLTPGWEQIGTVWLPLPHVLMLPLVMDGFLWRTGLAGAIASGICFVIATGFLYGAARRAFGSGVAGVTAAAIFALNPNMLYLQSIPMTEPVFFAALLGLVYFLVRIHQTPGMRHIIGAGLAALAGTMCRYDGWVLLPFVAAYIFWRAGAAGAVLFTFITAVGPLYWFAHNYWYCGNALEFYNGPYSPMAIQGGRDYPGKGDWLVAWQFYRSAAILNTGLPMALLAVPGTIAALIKRAWLPVLLLGLPMAFYLLSMHSSGGTPIFVPALYNDSYYNTRYGLALLPFGAFCIAGLISGPMPRLMSTILVLLSVSPWIAYPRMESWITWKESQVNSHHRRLWTAEAVEFMRANYSPGDKILMPLSDLVGIPRELGIPLRNIVHEGNGLAMSASLARPDLFVMERWAIGIAGDEVSRRVADWRRKGLYWDCVKIVNVKGAAPVEIYRRRGPRPPSMAP